MPSLIHHIASCDRLPRPTLAKGGPFASDRLGQSILPESALKDSLYLRPSGLRKPVADQQVPRGGVLQVSGSMRTPSPVRNHPLKSMAQTSLGLCAEAARPTLPRAVAVSVDAPAQLGPVCSLPCWAPANALVARPFEAMPPPSSAPTLDGPAWPRSAARLSPEASHWDDYAELGYGLPAHSTHTSGIAGGL